MSRPQLKGRHRCHPGSASSIEPLPEVWTSALWSALWSALYEWVRYDMRFCQYTLWNPAGKTNPSRGENKRVMHPMTWMSVWVAWVQSVSQSLSHPSTEARKGVAFHAHSTWSSQFWVFFFALDTFTWMQYITKKKLIHAPSSDVFLT